MRVHWPKFWCSYTIHLAANRFDLLNNKSRFFSSQKNSAEGCQQQNPLLTSLAAFRTILELSPGRTAERSWGRLKGKRVQPSPRDSLAAQSLPKELLDDISSSASRGAPSRRTNARTVPTPALLTRPRAALEAALDAQLFVARLAPRQGLPRSQRSRLRHTRLQAGERCLWNADPSSPSLPRLCSGEETMRRWPAAEVCPRKDLGWALL